MGKAVCAIFHCNEWQEYSSFRLIGIVEEDELDSALEEIQAETGYTDEEMDKLIFIDHNTIGELDI